jgi:hypothetical protein
VSAGLAEPEAAVAVTDRLKTKLLLLPLPLLILSCQVQIAESTPNANVCRNPPSVMLLDYQNDVENQVIQLVCFECHNSDGVARRISYSGNSRDNFCITFALGPNHPNKLLSNYPQSQGHIAASGKVFTQLQLQPLIDWVNRYAR